MNDNNINNNEYGRNSHSSFKKLGNDIIRTNAPKDNYNSFSKLPSFGGICPERIINNKNTGLFRSSSQRTIHNNNHPSHMDQINNLSAIDAHRSNDRIEPIVTKGDLQSSESDRSEESKQPWKKSVNKQTIPKVIKKRQRAEESQDLLTNHAINEIKDNIELYKLNINKYIQKLRDEQEKLKVDDMRAAIEGLQRTVLNNLKNEKSQNDKYYQKLKQSFWIFRDEVLRLIDRSEKVNNEKISNLNIELKWYQMEMNKRFTAIEDRQREYLHWLKQVLETTRDRNTREVVQQFLVDDKNIYIANKSRYWEDYNNNLIYEQDYIKEKENALWREKLRKEEEDLPQDVYEEEKWKVLEAEMKKKEDEIWGRCNKNNKPFVSIASPPEPKQEIQIHEWVEDNDQLQDKKSKLSSSSNDSISDSEHEPELESLSSSEISESTDCIQLRSLIYFTKIFLSGESSVKKYVKDVSRNAIINLLKSTPIDIVKYKWTYEKAISKTIKRMTKAINTHLNEFMDSLIHSVQVNSVPPQVANYLNYIIIGNNFIPYKFFTLFEISRLTISQGIIQNVTHEQKQMILAFYVFMKILVHNYWLDLNFLSSTDKSKIEEITIVNFKVIASIMFHEIIGCFKDMYVERTIWNWEEYRETQCWGNIRIKELLTKIDPHLMTGYPDDDLYTVDYIQMKWYSPIELISYYSMVKKKDSGLKMKIMFFWDKFIQCIMNGGG